MGRAEILSEVEAYALEKLYKPFIPGKTYIPPTSPLLEPSDIRMLVDSALEMWFTEWKYSERFKAELSRYLGYHPKVTLCNSGSSASTLAVHAAKEIYGNERRPYVITCATTFPTSITPIYQSGMMPFYVDIDPATLSPNFEQMDHILSKYHVKGIFLAHNLGFPYDECEVTASIAGKNIWFIADICDALGAKSGDGNHVGYHANVSTLSMFPAHQICAGEGGAVFCRDEQMHVVIESLSNWGRSCHCKPGQQNTCGMRFSWDDRGDLPEGWDHKYIFDRPGFNLKMTDLQAALGLSQLSRIEDFVWARNANYYRLLSNLADSEFLEFVVPPGGVRPSPFGFPILVKETAPFDAEDFIQYLEQHKIGTRRVFAGNITRQPGFMHLNYNKLDLSGSDRVMNQMFWIACGPFLRNGPMIDYMLDIIKTFLEQYE